MRQFQLAACLMILLATNRPAMPGERCCTAACPCCQHVCRLSIQDERETRYCWEVERKPTCIPPVRLPWQKCCTPKCARLRYVRVLKKVEYECPVCKHHWSPETTSCCEDGHWPPPLPADSNSDSLTGPRPARSMFSAPWWRWLSR